MRRSDVQDERYVAGTGMHSSAKPALGGINNARARQRHYKYLCNITLAGDAQLSRFDYAYFNSETLTRKMFSATDADRC
ncbi:MAG: hypothetical protein ACJAQ6_000447 [Arenicella sp.]|jgi:hypothetical protein